MFNTTYSMMVYHITQVMVASIAILLAAGESTDWLSILERLGLAAALVVFFVWASWQRERRMGKRIDYLEKQTIVISGKLAALGMLVTESMNKQGTIVDNFTKMLSSRPCVAFDSIEKFQEWKKASGHEGI